MYRVQYINILFIYLNSNDGYLSVNLKESFKKQNELCYVGPILNYW